MCSAVARPSLTQIRISHSDSSRPLDWQLVILLAMLYVSTITPYEVTVMDSTPLWLRVLNYGFDFIFFIDMSLQFFQGYHDAELKQMVYVSIQAARASTRRASTRRAGLHLTQIPRLP